MSWACTLLRSACSCIWQNSQQEKEGGGIFIPHHEKVAGGANEGLQRTALVFFFSGRKAIRNTPFSKCHKGLRIDPVTESDPTIPQNERSIKGKWHLGGPSLPLTQTCDRSRGNSGAIRRAACAACPSEAHDVIGKLSDSSRSQNSSGVNLNVGRKGILKELQQVSKLGGGCSLSPLSLLALYQTFFPSTNYRSVFAI